MEAIFIGGDELCDLFEECDLVGDKEICPQEIKKATGGFQKVCFETSAELDAFVSGVMAGVGWFEGYVIKESDKEYDKAKSWIAIKGEQL